MTEGRTSFFNVGFAPLRTRYSITSKGASNVQATWRGLIENCIFRASISQFILLGIPRRFSFYLTMASAFTFAPLSTNNLTRSKRCWFSSRTIWRGVCPYYFHASLWVSCICPVALLDVFHPLTSCSTFTSAPFSIKNRTRSNSIPPREQARWRGLLNSYS